MVFILILVGAVLGGMVLQGFGGAIVGGVLGYLAAWALKLNQRISRLENQQGELNKRVLRLHRDLEGAPPERPAAKAKPEWTKAVVYKPSVLGTF